MLTGTWALLGAPRVGEDSRLNRVARDTVDYLPAIRLLLKVNREATIGF
ncbi:MAG: hypothetical protein N2C14_15315 [Planctomycetales bacterium]